MSEGLPPSRSRLRLEGEYDLTRRDEVAALFNALDGDGDVVIDMTNVTYLDSTVLRELASLRLRNANRAITLMGLSPHIRHILTVVDFDKIFKITE